MKLNFQSTSCYWVRKNIDPKIPKKLRKKTFKDKKSYYICKYKNFNRENND